MPMLLAEIYHRFELPGSLVSVVPLVESGVCCSVGMKRSAGIKTGTKRKIPKIDTPLWPIHPQRYVLSKLPGLTGVRRNYQPHDMSSNVELIMRQAVGNC